MTVNHKSKKELLSKEINFCRSAARISKILGVRNKVIREKMGITKIILERMENNTLQRYGHALQMGDKRILTW